MSRDLEEMQELSNSSLSSSIMSEDVDEATTMKLKLSSLQQKYRNIVEQKASEGRKEVFDLTKCLGARCSSVVRAFAHGAQVSAQ